MKTASPTNLSISEWLPNPKGSDTTGEWIELLNGGEKPLNLSGWSVENGAGKTFRLSGTLAGGEYLTLPRSSTKLSLRNTDEALRLYDPSGRLTDETSFRGEAREGMSVNHAGSRSYFAAPTPGGANAELRAEMLSSAYEFGKPLHSVETASQLFAAMAGTALTLTLLVIFALKSHAITNELFFRSH